MNRRRYLGAVTVGAIAGLAGCTGAITGGGGDGDRTGEGGAGGTTTDETATVETATDETATDTTTRAPNTPNPGEVELPVPKSELNRGAAKNAIPAITDPQFGPDWGETSYSLDDGDRIIGVVRGNEARAYPLRILDWHEIVNDEFDGPLLVTYCPLCGSGLTAERRVQDEVTVFGVSGYLFQSDLVMYDEKTESLWSQIMATAIRGPRTGDQLTLVPSSLTTWGAWREEHPDSSVLLPPPLSLTIVDARPRPYDRNPYGGYSESQRIGIGYNDFDDDRLHPKTQVIGIATESAAKAYPFDAVEKEGVVNDTVGDRPVVVAAAPDGTLAAYSRVVGGETLTFEKAGNSRMTGGGSTWEVLSGRALDGPHEGTRLEAASNATAMFWFAWADFNPDTAIYGQ